MRLVPLLAALLASLAACGPAEGGTRGGSSQAAGNVAKSTGDGPTPTFAAAKTAGGLLVTVSLRRDAERPLARIRLTDPSGAELGVDESVAATPAGRPFCATFELDGGVDEVIAVMTDTEGRSWSRSWRTR